MGRGKWMALGVSMVLVALVGGAVALIRQESSRKAPAAAAPAPAAPPPAEITLPVRIEAQQTVAVSAQVTGTIETLLADVGEEVYEGQLLARISNHEVESSRENANTAVENAAERIAKLESAILASRLEASRARADAQRARTDMERTERAYRRQKMLYGEGATPRQAYEKSEREAASARGEHDSLDTLARQAEERVAGMAAELDNSKKLQSDKARQLEDAQAHAKAGEVVSPVSGIVVSRRGEAGKPLGEDGNMEMFQIAVNTALLEAVMEADPSAVARLAPGQQAMLFFADIPGEGIAGTVAQAANNQARIRFTSPTPLIKPGTTAQVRVTLR